MKNVRRRLAAIGAWRALDVAVAAAIGAGMLWELGWLLPAEGVGVAPLGLAAGLVAAGSLAWRRAFPLAVSCVVVSVGALMVALEVAPHSIALMAAWVVAVYSVARHCKVRTAVIGLVVVLAGSAVSQVLGSGGSLNDALAAVSVSAVAPWLTGALVRRVRESKRLRALARELEQQRDEGARTAVTQERARIAREIHDIVAHTVSLMVVQAEAGQVLLDERPAAAREAFEAIQDHGRQALVEMRRLLGMLRSDETSVSLDPQPGLAQVDQLATQLRDAGMPVDVHVEGSPEGLGAGLQLTVYRIVQEALTNSLKHGRRRGVTVTIRHLSDRVDVEVNDRGSGHGGQVLDASGFGLTGLQERVGLYGGRLDAGPQATGDFQVRASLPRTSEP